MRRPVCRTCKSPEVLIDAYAQWSMELQDWTLNSTHEPYVCEGECQGECSIEFEEVANG